MSLILRQVIGYSQGRRATPTTADPIIKNQLQEAQKQLNSILKKWKWDGNYPTTSQEFLAKFEPWINTRLEEQKNLKLFLAKKGTIRIRNQEDW